jgi:ParB family chromosome partitioning protein
MTSEVIASGTIGEMRSRLVSVPLDSVRPNPAQPRSSVTIDEDEITKLADTMERHGLLQPIVVQETDGVHTLVAGQRRLLAAKRLGWTTIDAIVIEGTAEEVALIENIQRQELHPMDLADSLNKLVQANRWTHEDAARAFGMGRSTISELIALAQRLAPSVKNEWRVTGLGSKSQLIALTSVSNAKEQYELWTQIAQGHAPTVAETRERKRGRSDIRSPLEQTVRAGQSFLRKLKCTDLNDWSGRQKEFVELTKLQREITAYIKGLKSVGRPTEPSGDAIAPDSESATTDTTAAS